MVGPTVDFPTQAVSLSVAVIGVPFRLHYRSGGGDRMWSWSVHHAYDPAGEMLSLGDGRQRPASPVFRQWASDATASSEYGAQDYSAKQATGKPDTSTHADAKTAWAPRSQDGTTEWLELTYERAVKPAAINIRETFNPGFVTKVEAYNAERAQWLVLWQGKDPTTKESMVFSPPLSKATYTTKRIRLTIDTNVPGWNEIDAVELVTQSPAWLSAGEVAIVAPDGGELYVFNDAGRHLRTLNALTRALLWRFAYDSAGRLMAVEDGYGNATRTERNANGVATAVVAPYGQRTLLGTGADGYLANIKNPAGETISFTYSGDRQLAAVTDPRGGVYRFTIDAQGHVTKHEDAAGGFLDLARTFTDKGYKVSSKTAMGRESTYSANRVSDSEASAVTTGPGDSEIQLHMRTDGTATIAYSDGRMLTRTHQPDPRWGPQSPLLKTVSVATPGGLTSTLSLNRSVTLADSSDSLSLTTLIDTTRINGQSYTRTFDATSKQISWLSPAGRRTTTTLDEHGRVVKVDVPGLLPTGFAYDGRGQLTTFTQGKGAYARLGSVAYDATGQIAAVTDSVKRTVRFEYDSTGRIRKRILPDGREITLKYDANGNMTSITPPGRPAHSFEYTPVNVIKAYLPPHVEQGLGDISYVYNKDGQLDKTLRPDGTTTEFIYDSGGRLSAVTIPGGQPHFGYDPKTTRLTTITAPNGGVLSYTYDGSLLTKAAWTGGIEGTVNFTYNSNLGTASTSVNGESPVKLEHDPDGLLARAGSLGLRRDGASGLLTGSLLGNVVTAQDYNGFGELKSLRVRFKGREILADRYERDALGRIVRKSETIDGQTRVSAYSYDVAGRLTDVRTNGTRTAHYEYDANGNRMMYVGLNGTVKATYDAQDRVKQYGKAAYAFTANGEWLSKTVDGSTTTYSYDVFGNLNAASLPNGTKIDYVVDGANQRIGKKVNGKLVQGFLYQDQLRVIAELNGQNQVVARFIYAVSSNVPDYMTKGGKTYRIIADLLGSPRIVIDADTGAIAQRMEYDEFGNVLRDTNPAFQPFGFAGGIYDRVTGLTRFGLRDYDPITGRWTTKDPIGFRGGDTNLYLYLLNDPANSVDPTGLQPAGIPTKPSWDWGDFGKKVTEGAVVTSSTWAIVGGAATVPVGGIGSVPGWVAGAVVGGTGGALVAETDYVWDFFSYERAISFSLGEDHGNPMDPNGRDWRPADDFGVELCGRGKLTLNAGSWSCECPAGWEPYDGSPCRQKRDDESKCALQPGPLYWCFKEKRCVPLQYWDCNHCGCGQSR